MASSQFGQLLSFKKKHSHLNDEHGLLRLECGTTSSTRTTRLGDRRRNTQFLSDQRQNLLCREADRHRHLPVKQNPRNPGDPMEATRKA
jgi:hypothetical protein